MSIFEKFFERPRAFRAALAGFVLFIIPAVFQPSIAVRALAAGDSTVVPAAASGDRSAIYRDARDRAVALCKAGKLTDGAAVLENYVETVRSLRDPRAFIDTGAVNLLSKIATVLQDQGDYKNSEKIFRSCVAAHCLLAGGAESPEAAVSMNNLATLLRLAGKYPEAGKLYESAIAAIDRHHGPGSADAATMRINLGWLRYLEARYDLAEKAYAECLASRTALFGEGHTLVAEVLNNLGRLECDAGDHEAAAAHYEKARKIYEKNLEPGHPDLSPLYSNIATLHKFRGEFDRALPLYEKAYEIDLKAYGPENPVTATSMNDLAGAFGDAGDRSKALSLYERVLVIRERTLGPDHPDTAMTYNNLGVTLRDLGRFAEAERYFERSAASYTRSLEKTNPEAVIPISNAADLQIKLGKYSMAAAGLSKVITIREKSLGPDHPDTATAYNNLGALYFRLRQFDRAIPLYKRSIAAYEKKFGREHPALAARLNNLGQALFLSGDTAEAAACYSRGISIALKERSGGGAGAALVNLYNASGLLYAGEKRYAEAYGLYSKAMEAIAAAGPSRSFEKANLAYNMGKLMMRMNEPAKALEHFKTALECAAGPSGEGYAAAMALLGISEARTAAGDNGGALQALNEALAKLESFASASGGEEYSAPVRSMQESLCSAFVDLCHSLGDMDRSVKAARLFELFSMMELSRSRAFAEQICSSSAMRYGALPAEELFRLRSLTARISGIRERLAPPAAGTGGGMSEAASSSLERSLAGLIDERRALEVKLCEKYPGYAALRKPAAPTLTSLRGKVLEKGEAFVGMWQTDEHLAAFVATSSEASLVVADLSRARSDLLVRRFMSSVEDMADAATYKKSAQELYSAAFEPIMERLAAGGVRTAFVAAHGPLAGVPLEALVTSGNGADFPEFDYLFKKLDIAYVPSASALSALRRAGVRSAITGGGDASRLPALLFGDPVYSPPSGLKGAGRSDASRGGTASDAVFGLALSYPVTGSAKRAPIKRGSGGLELASLPASAKEVDYISGLFYGGRGGGNINTGENALESKIKKLDETGELRRYERIHFAVHGFLGGESDGISESCIALSLYGDTAEDGLLKTGEIFGLGLSADMVTLSACRSGVEREKGGPAQGLSDLARAFFYAGAKRLIVSLWSVSDEGTFEFMKEFYSSLSKGGIPVMRPLKAARLKMLENKEFCHPGFWAPFILVGEWK